ncbi:MAG: glutaminyl-peptide cyclotransferase [Bacteroidia bacterium]|nr:glutaminyl-peptide cyclotransferase [Bacteroidia bacterium]
MENIKMMNKKIISCFAIALSIVSFSSCEPEVKKDPEIKTVVEEKPVIPVLEHTIVATLPHDTTAFTEGLLIHDNKLFESTGSPDHMPQLKSVFGIVDWKTGKLDVKGELDKKTFPFGEGIVILKNKLYQVTYQNQTGFIYDAKTFKKIGQFNYSNKEGWGLTTDGTNIIMSDGTNNLTYFDPKEMKVLKVLAVSENGYATDALNELEYINGFIYANIWMTGYVVKIDPASGKVLAKINFTPISYQMRNLHPNTLEMNGIAFDSIADKIYVTGKLWPTIYQVNFPH